MDMNRHGLTPLRYGGDEIRKEQQCRREMTVGHVDMEQIGVRC